MPVSVIIDHPESNLINMSKKFIEIGTGFISIKGHGNSVEIGNPLDVGSAHFVVTGGATISIGDGCVLGNLGGYALAEKSILRIGDGTAFNGGSQITIHETATISIVKNCLIAPETSLMASDVHKIFDSDGCRINPADDIIVGDRVWIGARCALLRGTQIGDDCVVGWASVVRGSFPSNSIIAGIPARIVRSGITWKP